LSGGKWLLSFKKPVSEELEEDFGNWLSKSLCHRYPGNFEARQQVSG